MNMPRVSIRDISPEIATEWLKLNNDSNRKLRIATVEKYSRFMQAGEWILNDQCISFDTENKLLNGQHRLQAIIASGVTIKSLVATDMDTETFKYTDQGSNRSIMDIHKSTRQMHSFISGVSKVFGNHLQLSYKQYENTRNYLIKLNDKTEITIEELLAKLPKSKAKIITSGPSYLCFAYWCYKTGDTTYLINFIDELVKCSYSLEHRRYISPRGLSFFQILEKHIIGNWNIHGVVKKLLSFYDPKKRNVRKIVDANPEEVSNLRAWLKKVSENK